MVRQAGEDDVGAGHLHSNACDPVDARVREGEVEPDALSRRRRARQTPGVPEEPHPGYPFWIVVDPRTKSSQAAQQGLGPWVEESARSQDVSRFLEPAALPRVVLPEATEGGDLLVDEKGGVATKRDSVDHQQVVKDDVAITLPGESRRE